MKSIKKIIAIVLVCILVPTFLAGVFITQTRLQVEVPQDEMLPYQAVFEHYAPLVGWDWELLAAVAYHESHFNPKAHSYAGACGVMQLMPKTAHRFGLNDSTIWVPEDNIRAGVEYIQFLQRKWAFIQNKDEQTKFVLASYNVGPGFIFTARRQVREGGKGNAYVWADVEPYVHSSHTRHYVKHVLKTANKYRNDYTEWKANCR